MAQATGVPLKTENEECAGKTLELAIEVWRLRCSVFRGIPMAFFCVYFKELTCYEI